ncbi:MAG: phosphoserine phosphatase SerB, partial [Geminicoccales bacterium]
MAQMVCLIGDPERQPLDDRLVTRLARTLGGTPRWLSDGEACELAVDGADSKALLAATRAEVAGMALDVCVVPAADRVKRVLVCDLDSTIITIETIDELADFAGVKAEVAAITRRAMRGELDFEAALKARVALLEGLSPSVFDDVYRDRARLMPGARTLIRTMRAQGAITALVSGGFMPLAEKIRDDVGFHLVDANRLEVAHGRLTGRLTPPIVGPDAKLAMLERLRAEQSLTAAATLAVG